MREQPAEESTMGKSDCKKSTLEKNITITLIWDLFLIWFLQSHRYFSTFLECYVRDYIVCHSLSYCFCFFLHYQTNVIKLAAALLEFRTTIFFYLNISGRIPQRSKHLLLYLILDCHCYPSKNWLSSRCLTSVIVRELVFPSWHQPLTLPWVFWTDIFSSLKLGFF